MASRYTQEYFFQHMLINVSFTNLNKIIHPNAESIPEYIRHYASAMFVNSSFWEDRSKVFEELQMEGHRHEYINSYMSYLDILKSTYSLITKDKTFFFFDSNISIITSMFFFHQPQPFLYFTYSIFNIFKTRTFSNINEKDGRSFSLTLYFEYFYYLYLYLLILSNFLLLHKLPDYQPCN